MILSHNSLTYQSPRHSVFKLVKWLWRTQEKGLIEQYDAGARYFDIRVRRNGDKWRCCHGIVDLQWTFGTLAEIAEFFKDFGYVRIILERGDGEKFKEESAGLLHLHVRQVVIKHGWHVLKDLGPWCGEDYTYRPWDTGQSFWWNLRHVKFSTIKRWARLHNPPVTEEKIKSGEIFVYDYL